MQAKKIQPGNTIQRADGDKWLVMAITELDDRFIHLNIVTSTGVFLKPRFRLTTQVKLVPQSGG